VKIVSTFIALFFVFLSHAQIDSLHYKSRIFKVQDSIVFNPLSSNPYYFAVFTTKDTALDSLYYAVDFKKSTLFLKKQFQVVFPEIDSIKIQYYTYPKALTKTYQHLDPAIIITDSLPLKPKAIYHKKEEAIKPFEGLNTQGAITRGVTVGNNQDAVLNSVLDLKIEGKLSSKVLLRARINDTNIPIQENGYSQDLKDLDRVYIEMIGPHWKVQAGDIFLKNKDSHFMNFTKKVSGVGVQADIDSTHIFSSAALVKGRFTTDVFQGEEANQGPYKLNGKQGESYIFIISGSEKVYINGLRQTRGENNDYVIDYNTAEIRFTPTKPITANMRIQVEFQYSDRNYTRFVTHNTATYKTKKLQIGAGFYRESDVKEQPLQLNLSTDQIALLAQSGNSNQQIFVPNITETTYDENKILYRFLSDGVYEYSTDINETLYQVRFTYFGYNQGDYKIAEYLAMGKKMQYVGKNKGDYKAVIPLTAPSSQQIMAINTSYKPNIKTDFAVELAYADTNHNLFSNQKSAKAPALAASWNQVLIDSVKRNWRLENHINIDFIHHKFKSIERIFEIEFDRDWNLQQKTGSQRLLSNRLSFLNTKNNSLYYQFDNLNLTQYYNGNKHQIAADINYKKISIQHQSSYLKSTGMLINTSYARSHSEVKYKQKKWWIKTAFDLENNRLEDTKNHQLNQKSFQFLDLKNTLGVGDTTGIFVKIGADFRANDSLLNRRLTRVNNSSTFFINTQLIKTKSATLLGYINYRKLDYINKKDVASINSKLTYRQQLFNQLISLQSNFKNTSGNLAQQEYTYIETEPGQGYYTWIDYNENNIQELDEFEIAQYADQANYLRIALAHLKYIPTQEAALQQRIQINFSKWSNKNGFKKLVSHWYNEFNILAKNNRKRTDRLVNLNPFDAENTNTLGMQFNLRNALIFNRGKAHYTTAYNYTQSKQKIMQSFGNQYNKIKLHQIVFKHKVKENWQLGCTATQSDNTSQNSSFANRNYQLFEQSIAPNLSYFFNAKHWIKATYTKTNKNNKIGDLESLKQQQITLNYSYTNTKQSVFSVEIKALQNNFNGTNYSVVGYQMLAGLQPDNNMIWSLLWSKKINSYLFLNLHYNARANTFSPTIHNGNVQLRAHF